MTSPTQQTLPRQEWVLERVSGRSVLHVGFAGQSGRRAEPGSGTWFHERLDSRASELWGLDADAYAVQHFREMGVRNLVAADACDFDLNRRFDVVVAGELLEHVTDAGRFLDCAQRHLKPGGVLLVTTPYAFNLFALLRAWYRFPNTVSNDDHTCWYCPRTLEQLAAKTGYEVRSLSVVSDYRTDLGSRSGRAASQVGRLLSRVLPPRVLGSTIVADLRPVK